MQLKWDIGIKIFKKCKNGTIPETDHHEFHPHFTFILPLLRFYPFGILSSTKFGTENMLPFSEWSIQDRLCPT